MKKLLTLIAFLLLANPAWAAFGECGFGDCGSGGGGVTVGGAVSGGTDTRVLYNDGGLLGEDAGLTYNKTTDALTAGSFVSSSAAGSIYSSNGTIIMGGVNGTNNESLSLNFESTSNRVALSSATGLTDIYVGDLILKGDDYITVNSDYGVRLGGGFADVTVAFQANTPAVTMFTLRMDDTYDQIVFSPASTRGNQIVLGGVYTNKDFDHAQPTDPTLFIQSIKDPDTSNNEWASLAHVGTELRITTGANIGAGTTPATRENGISFYPRGTLGVSMDGSGGLIPKKVTADPCASMGEGAIFYNDTSNYMCYCTASSTDVKMADDTTPCF